MSHRTILLLCRVALLAPLVAAPPAQELRVAIESAPVVLVGHHRGVRPHGDDYLLHKVVVARTLRGEIGAEVSVLEWKKVSLHQRPAIAATRLYCLHPVEQAARLGLPPGPHYRLDAHQGSHPAIDAGGQVVAFAQLLLAAQRGGSLAEHKAALLELALTGAHAVRCEAARLCSERAALLAALDPLDLSAVLAKASAETEDIEYKIALATVCAERRMPALLEALCLSWPQIDDENFSRAVGRFARHLHGENATDELLPYLQRAREPKLRGHVLLALGATSTESAKQALLRARKLEKDTAAVDAALRLHGGK
jgi:hypothetical protein